MVMQACTAVEDASSCIQENDPPCEETRCRSLELMRHYEAHMQCDRISLGKPSIAFLAPFQRSIPDTPSLHRSLGSRGVRPRREEQSTVQK